MRISIHYFVIYIYIYISVSTFRIECRHCLVNISVYPLNVTSVYPALSFIIAAFTFNTLHKMLTCGQSNESYQANTFTAVILLTTPSEGDFKWFIQQYFPVVLFVMLYKVVLTLESVVEILKCDYSNESY